MRSSRTSLRPATNHAVGLGGIREHVRLAYLPPDGGRRPRRRGRGQLPEPLPLLARAGAARRARRARGRASPAGADRRADAADSVGETRRLRVDGPCRHRIPRRVRAEPGIGDPFPHPIEPATGRARPGPLRPGRRGCCRAPPPAAVRHRGQELAPPRPPRRRAPAPRSRRHHPPGALSPDGSAAGGANLIAARAVRTRPLARPGRL